MPKNASSRAGIEHDIVHRNKEHLQAEIVKTAQERGCDVIFQAAHGRPGRHVTT